MSRLDELIQQYCPNGVEYKPIGECLDYEQPTKYLVESTAYDDSYSTPVLTAGQSFILGYTNETGGIYNASVENPVIIFDDFTTASKWVDFGFKAKSSAMKMLTSADSDLYNIRYLYHCMQNLKYTPSDHARQWISKYGLLEIPVPPLPVQEEIVRILDKFTELEQELEQELELRKKQYEYYRDKMLSLSDYDGEVEWKPLSEVAEIGTGSHNTQDATDDGNYTFYVRSQTPLKLDTYDYDDISIITAGDGVGVGKVFHITNGKYALHQRAYRIHPLSNEINTKFLYYYFTARFYNYITMTKYDGSVSSIRLPMLKEFSIPVIKDIHEQERIVNVLDKFSTLISDISEGLPAEIKMRHQQYEYYRDKLLNFKRLEVV